MREEQTQFPYVLITENTEIVLKADDFALDGVQSGFGVFTFRSESQFGEIFNALRETSDGFALVQAHYSSFHGDANFSRVFNHLI
ncbi:MAG TPA: hypothetical protein VGC62_03870 [Pseudomonas sp.]|uniref:hypothetical protein n=1 Tax=Pseudomonas sp. TaxID=306 RepID=UPI002ED98FC0